MQKIKVLPENLSNMIAAGEVVERPASVVKELIENSIDANADRIEISCQKSGKRMIKVMDNGCGMEYEDALTCIERHATSKIEKVEDLDSIQTLGFRGEAIPSIASVSEMILTTRSTSSQTATRIYIQNGTIKNVSQTGSPIGTIVEVRNLFSNLPARAKFLRSDQTELSHIVQTVIRQSMPKPEISFILTHNGHTCLHLAKTLDFKQRLIQILGDESGDQIKKIENEKEGIKIKGYISSLEATRSNPLSQYLYVNHRFIRSQIIQKAIHEAYYPQLPKQRYPFFCILIYIDPQRVDFNVHPAKLEIRFDEPSKIVDLISTAVKNSLNQPMIFPKLRHTQPSPLQTGNMPNLDKSLSFGSKRSNFTSLSPSTRQMPLLKEKAQILYKSAQQEGPDIEGFKRHPVSYPTSEPDRETDKQPDIETDSKTPYNLLDPKGPFIQIDYTYILYESQDGLVIIDQHAAHERINYERVKASFLAESHPTQILITQPLINVTHEEDVLMEQALPLLRDLGFFLEPFGNRTYILRSVPIFLNIEPTAVLQEIIHKLLEHRSCDGKVKIIDPIAAAIACHLSIKAHQPLKTEEIKQLLNDLLSSNNPFSCPHGRPTLFRISIKELEKNFRRQ